MSEVQAKTSQLRFSFRAIAICLSIAVLFALSSAWAVNGTHWGASSGKVEWFRKYLVFVNQYRPTVKQVDNLSSALRIHSIESLGGKRFALLFSVTDKAGNPVGKVSPYGISIMVNATGEAPKPATVERVTPISAKTEWTIDRANFANIMDYSGSMFLSDLKNTEDNYSSFLMDLQLPLSASVIKFASEVEESLQLSTNKTDIINAVKKATPMSGATSLYESMDKGVDQIAKKPHLRFLLLVTDGNANGGMRIDEILQKCRKNFVSVFALGFGWLDVDVLTRLADDTDGYFSYVPDSADLKMWFQKLAAIVNNVQVLEFSTESAKISNLDLTVNVAGVAYKRSRPF